MRLWIIWIMAAMALLAAGCAKNTPCKQFTDARWICNLQVVDAVQPGDLIYVRNDELLKVKLPDQVHGFEIRREPANVAAVTGKSDWRFGLDAGLADLPGIASVSTPKAKLEAAGFREIDFVFEDTTIESLGSMGTGPQALAEAKRLADQYLDAMTPLNRESMADDGPADGQVWLVMQTLRSRVRGKFVEGGSLSGDVGAVIEGVAANVKGGSADVTSNSIVIEEPLPIAYRAIPLAVTRTGGGGLQGPVEIRVEDVGEFSGPRSR